MRRVQKFSKKGGADLDHTVSSFHGDRILPLTEFIFRNPFTVTDLPKTALGVKIETCSIYRKDVHIQTSVAFFFIFLQR